MLTLEQQARRLSITKNQLDIAARNADIPVNASKIWIDDEELTGYLDYTFAYQKTYPEEPTRTASGVIGNLNSFASFLTPTLTIRFAYMKIATYRWLLKKLHSKNEFVVKCYDVENDCFTTQKMYFKPEEAPELFKRNLDFLAVIDYTIELVGTNADLGLFSVVYNSNPPDDTGVSNITQADSNEYVAGEEILIGENVASEGEIKIQQMTFNDKYSFLKWNTKSDGSGTSYIDNQPYIFNESDLAGNTLVLYAQWNSVQDHNYTLSYNYGLGNTYIDESTGKELYSKTIAYMSAYGTLPTTTVPPVSYGDDTYDNAYSFKGWFRTPEIGEGSIAITANTLYSTRGNSTLYQIYEANDYTITFNSDGGNVTPPAVTMPYNSRVALPNYITKEGYTLSGWKDADRDLIATGANVAMPPTNITLIAQWEAINND